MDNPGQCSVCFTDFEEIERRPRTLPCGHTLCSPCIGDMIEGDQLSCPTCRASHSTNSATQFPINYNTEAFVKQIQALKLRASSNVNELPGESLPPAAEVRAGIGGPQVISRKLRCLLEEQKSSVGNLAKDSQGLQSQLDQYRVQLADWKTQHHHLLKRLYELVDQNEAVLKLLELEDTKVLAMKKEGEKGKKQLKTTLGCLKTVNTAQEVVTAIDHADQCNVEVEDWIQKCQEQFPNFNTVITSRKVHETTSVALNTVTAGGGGGGAAAAAAAAEVPDTVDPSSTILDKVKKIVAQLKLSSVKDLLKMRPCVRQLVEAGHVYVVENKDGVYSSQITLEDNKLYFHCLSNQTLPSDAHTVLVSEVLGALDLSSTLVFLDLMWASSKRGRVHIRLSPDTILARQFILHCIGQSGKSFLKNRLCNAPNLGECLENSVVNCFLPDTIGGTTNSSYPQSNINEAGSVFCSFSINPLTLFGGFQQVLQQQHQQIKFAIRTKDAPIGVQCRNIFGQVEKGLEVVQAAVLFTSSSRCVTGHPVVKDCGLVIPL